MLRQDILKMDNELMFSIIIPIYNSSQYLIPCIQSILKQKYKCFELLLIDDGSTDDSLKICERFKSTDNRVKTFSQVNKGVSSARNFGLAKASGKYILFVDSDDYVKSNYLIDMYKFIENKDIDVLFFNVSMLEKGIEYPQFLSNKFDTSKKLSVAESIESVMSWDGYLGYSCNKLYNRQSIKDVRFNENIFFLEDLIFNVTVLNEMKDIYCLPLPLYVYRQRSNSVSKSKYDKRSLSYFEALDILREELPSKFAGDIELRRKIALIDFSSKAIKKNDSLYKKLKNVFLRDKNKQVWNSNYGFFENSIVRVAYKNFFLAVKLMNLRKSIGRTKIYHFYDRLKKSSK